MPLHYLLDTKLTPLRSIEKRAAKFDYGKTKVQGVNLGGWFVLEPWITPSLFNQGDSVVDEYTLSKALGKQKALSTLSNHWKSWITQADFTSIAGAGLNHVRIPVCSFPSVAIHNDRMKFWQCWGFCARLY